MDAWRCHAGRRLGGHVVEKELGRTLDHEGRRTGFARLASRREAAMTPRVMILIAANSITGPAKGALQLCKAAGNLGGELFLCNVRTANTEFPFETEVRKSDCPVTYLSQRSPFDAGVLLLAKREAQARAVNIIQTHGYKPSLIGLYLKLALGIRWVGFLHGVTFENLKVRAYHLLDQIALRFADRVILVSEAQRAGIIGGRNVRRVRVVRNAVDLEHPVRGEEVTDQLIASLRLDRSDKVLVYVGRLSPEKGVDVLLRALAGVATKFPHVKLVIVGDGQERGRLQAQAMTLGIGDRVIFTGYTEAPGAYLVAADVVVMPSRSEGTANALLEAMALGRPIVATGVGGTPELIESGRSGLLVPSESPQELGDAILTLLEDGGFAERLGRGGLDRVRGCFAPEGRARAMFDIYNELLAGG
jgi:glycosyltransferase involved in cell wall biosynthesis